MQSSIKCKWVHFYFSLHCPVSEKDTLNNFKLIYTVFISRHFLASEKVSVDRIFYLLCMLRIEQKAKASVKVLGIKYHAHLQGTRK